MTVLVLVKILTCPSISEHDVGKSWVSFLNPVKSKLKFGGFEWAKPTNPTTQSTRLSFISHC